MFLLFQDLSYNNLGTEGGKLLCKALEKSRFITKIQVAGKNLGLPRRLGIQVIRIVYFGVKWLIKWYQLNMLTKI